MADSEVQELESTDDVAKDTAGDGVELEDGELAGVDGGWKKSVLHTFKRCPKCNALTYNKMWGVVVERVWCSNKSCDWELTDDQVSGGTTGSGGATGSW